MRLCGRTCEESVQYAIQLSLFCGAGVETGNDLRPPARRDQDSAGAHEFFEPAHCLKRNALNRRKDHNSVTACAEHQFVLLDASGLLQYIVVEEIKAVPGIKYRADNIRADTITQNFNQVWIAAGEVRPRIVVR